MYQIWRIYLDLWGHDCKKWVWPTFGCKLGQNDPIVMQLKLDMSCHLLNVYTKFQIDISKHVEEKSGRTDGRTDGQTDGRTLPRHNTSRFSNGRIKTLISLGTVENQGHFCSMTECHSFGEAIHLFWRRIILFYQLLFYSFKWFTWIYKIVRMLRQRCLRGMGKFCYELEKRTHSKYTSTDSETCPCSQPLDILTCNEYL